MTQIDYSKVKFYVAPENLERMQLYRLAAPIANVGVKEMENGHIKDPTQALHMVFLAVFSNMPRFRDPIPDPDDPENNLGLTEIEFITCPYVGGDADADENTIGWRYVDMEDGTLGVASKYTEDATYEAWNHFITLDEVPMDEGR